MAENNTNSFQERFFRMEHIILKLMIKELFLMIMQGDCLTMRYSISEQKLYGFYSDR